MGCVCLQCLLQAMRPSARMWGCFVEHVLVETCYYYVSRAILQLCMFPCVRWFGVQLILASDTVYPGKPWSDAEAFFGLVARLLVRNFAVQLTWLFASSFPLEHRTRLSPRMTRFQHHQLPCIRRNELCSRCENGPHEASNMFCNR